MIQAPLPRSTALTAVARCTATASRMLLARQVHQPRDRVGLVLRFADGTSARVYRETAVEQQPTEPCVLVVAFRLRLVHGRWHRLFEWESLLNTPLFVGFPGFVSKLWLAHDEHGTYRGLYEWDGAGAAERYARSLWRVLELVSVPGSIEYHVVPGIHRDQVLADARVAAGPMTADEWAWWRPLASA